MKKHTWRLIMPDGSYRDLENVTDEERFAAYKEGRTNLEIFDQIVANRSGRVIPSDQIYRSWDRPNK